MVEAPMAPKEYDSVSITSKFCWSIQFVEERNKVDRLYFPKRPIVIVTCEKDVPSHPLKKYSQQVEDKGKKQKIIVSP